jgi:hypothetical protein
VDVQLYNGDGSYKRTGRKWTFAKGDYTPKPKTLKALTALA